MLAQIIAFASLALVPLAPSFMPKDVHPNKKYRTFEAFYPFYLGEHSHPTNKTLHVIGTTIIVGIGLFYPFTICPALLFAGSIGYFIMYLTYNLPHGFVELGCMMGAFNVIMYIMEGGFGWWTVVPFIGYAFAWVGHFFFEKNKPATFTYAIYSLMGDFRMLFETYRKVITGN